jgi:hypothetical protein
LSEAAVPIHRERDVQEVVEAGPREVGPAVHLPDDVREFLEVGLLRREQRHALEEGDDRLHECCSVADDVDEGAVTLAVRLDVPAAQSPANELQHLRSVAVLADVKLRHELQPEARAGIALDRDRERALSVDVACDVAVERAFIHVG